jgi:outer membrane protein assembly factor BamD (BamD/ComL family)
MRAISSLLLALTILGGNGCNNPDKDWKDAEAKNTIAAYERFLSNHPGHAKAKVAIARIDWGKAKQKNTIEAYETFVSKHPNDVNAIEASSRLEELNRPLDWQKAKSEGSINAYQEFLTKGLSKNNLTISF